MATHNNVTGSYCLSK